MYSVIVNSLFYYFNAKIRIIQIWCKFTIFFSNNQHHPPTFRTSSRGRPLDDAKLPRNPNEPRSNHHTLKLPEFLRSRIPELQKPYNILPMQLVTPSALAIAVSTVSTTCSQSFQSFIIPFFIFSFLKKCIIKGSDPLMMQVLPLLLFLDVLV